MSICVCVCMMYTCVCVFVYISSLTYILSPISVFAFFPTQINQTLQFLTIDISFIFRLTTMSNFHASSGCSQGKRSTFSFTCSLLYVILANQPQSRKHSIPYFKRWVRLLCVIFLLAAFRPCFCCCSRPAFTIMHLLYPLPSASPHFSISSLPVPSDSYWVLKFCYLTEHNFYIIPGWSQHSHLRSSCTLLLRPFATLIFPSAKPHSHMVQTSMPFSMPKFKFYFLTIISFIIHPL